MKMKKNKIILKNNLKILNNRFRNQKKEEAIQKAKNLNRMNKEMINKIIIFLIWKMMNKIVIGLP